MKRLMLLATMCCAFGASAYTLDNGVLTVFVDTGETQTNLTDDQLAGLADAACTELRKTGTGELKLEATPVALQGFKGTIRISEGILTMNFGRWGGLLGTADGPTIVENGATLKTMNYQVWYDHEPLTISGTGYDNHGAIWHTGEAGATSFGKVTLAGDTTIINDSTSRQFYIRNDVFDMGGHDLTMRGPNGAWIGVDPTEIVNPGNLTFVGNGWGIPCKAVLDHGTNHTITLEYTGKQGREPHTNYCNWTMKIVNPNCGIRAYTPPFIWDGPLELPDTGTFIFECDAPISRATPDNFYVRFNGPISGGSAVQINTANVNSMMEGPSYVIFAGTNTYTGGTKMIGNAKGPLVCMVPESLPGVMEAAEAGEYPASSVYSVGSYVHMMAMGARTAKNPGGWTDAQMKKVWAAFTGHATCAVYAAPGDAATVNLDSTGGINYSSLNMCGIGGGDVTFVTDWTDNPRFFNNYLGTNTIYSARDGAAAESTLGDSAMFTGRMTFRNAGYIKQNGYIYAGTLTPDYFSDLTIDEGTTLAYGDKPGAWIRLCIAYRTGAGACGRVTLLPGGAISNGVTMSASSAGNGHSAFVQKGGTYRTAYESNAGNGPNSSSYIELQAGTSDFDHGFRLGVNPSSCATFVQTGGDTTSKGFFNGEGGTSTVYVTGGTFHHAGDMYIPHSYQAIDTTNGYASVTFANGVEPVVTNKVVLADRVDSTGILNLNSGAMLSAVSVEKQPGVTSKDSLPLSGNAAYVNFNGGGLKASAAGDLIKGGDAAIDRATVYEGGAIFDTAGYDVAVQVPLVAPSGSGIASITLPAAVASRRYYTAPTVIIFGDGTGASAVVGYDEQNFYVTNVTVTSSGCGYTTATAYLYLHSSNCVALDVTLGANAATGGLTKKGEGTLTLSGANTYGGDTVVEAGTLKFASASALPSGSSIISKGGAVGAAEYADVPKSIAFEVDDPVDGQRYVLASWDDGVAGAAGDFTVTGLPACWSLAVRNGKLVAAHFRGMMFTVR